MAIVFFAAVFLYFGHPLRDGDFWWHLNTGRWIAAHKALPDPDPFTYTLTAEYEDRARMFVRSNWLAQIAYYAVYRAAGFNGLRIANAALFTLITFVLYRTMRMQGMDAWWALLLTSPCAAIAWHYDELRPLGCSILFTALFLHLIEGAEVRTGHRGWTRLAWLVPLALLWANIHRGFPLVYLLIVPYAAVRLVRRRVKDALWLAAAGGAALLNPGGIQPVLSAAAESFQGTGSFHIMELARPWHMAAVAGIDRSYLPLLFGIMTGSLFFMAWQWRHLRAEHVIVYAVFAVAGLTAFRYSIYFVVVAASTCAPYAARVLEEGLGTKLWRGARLGGPVVIGLFIASSARPTRQAVYTESLPVTAVSAMLENELPEPLLNTYDWGGYISWAAWPQYRVFIDSRLLDYSVFQKLERASSGSVAPLLREYGINTVIYPPVDFRNLCSQRVVRELMADEEWRLAFFDTTATLFVRRSAAPSAPESSEERLGEYLLSVVGYRMRSRSAVAEDYFETFAILKAMGREKEAARALESGRSMLRKAGAGHKGPAAGG
jgi:hypothetical protein